MKQSSSILLIKSSFSIKQIIIYHFLINQYIFQSIKTYESNKINHLKSFETDQFIHYPTYPFFQILQLSQLSHFSKLSQLSKSFKLFKLFKLFNNEMMKHLQFFCISNSSLLDQSNLKRKQYIIIRIRTNIQIR